MFRSDYWSEYIPSRDNCFFKLATPSATTAVTTIAVFLAAVGVVAVISYYFIEKPISKLINKII